MKQLYTWWGRNFDENNILTGYPRPQMKRKSYVNLNGRWETAFTDRETKRPEDVIFNGTILVPYSPESALSGVGRQLKPDELLWYRRIVPVSEELREGKRALLHFGAVDQMCRVYVNRQQAGRHIGGYLPFTVDLTEYLEDDAREFELIVCVKDTSETSYHSRGKQLLERGGMWYTAQSGIWQTVWMEYVPKCYIKDCRITPEAALGTVRIELELSEDGPVREKDFSVEIRQPFIDKISEARAEECKTPEAYNSEVFKDKDYHNISYVNNIQTEDFTVVKLKPLHGTGKAKGSFAELSFSVSDRRLWSPEKPYLYYFKLRAFEDDITGYFAFREISIEKPDRFLPPKFLKNKDSGNDGDLLDKLVYEIASHPRICLNYTPYFQNGVLDQGYYPEGLYTAPHDLAYMYDILKMKELGFNMLRKHLKIEPDRFYYFCDRIGMTVWQDMVNGGGRYKYWFVTYLATGFNMVRYRMFDNCYGLLARKDKAGRREFAREMVETAQLLYNHPCITTWVIFNEGWGQFDAKRMTKLLRRTDPTRLIDSASGWYDQSCGDLRSQHYYFMKLNVQWCFRRATVLSEYGGFPYRIEGHSASDKIYGYHNCRSLKELHRRYKRLMEKIIEPEIRKGLSATVYTQLSDIEDEVNGILTYDREVCKI